MKRYAPFLFAIVATLLAVGLGLAFTRTNMFELNGREIHWRRLLGRAVDGAADLLEPEVAA